MKDLKRPGALQETLYYIHRVRVVLRRKLITSFNLLITYVFRFSKPIKLT